MISDALAPPADHVLLTNQAEDLGKWDALGIAALKHRIEDIPAF